MDKNKEIKKSELIKNELREKQKIISGLQTKKFRLEIKKNNIEKGKKNILSKIISYLLYDLIMIIIFVFCLSRFSSTLYITNQAFKTLYIVSLYISLITISILGAYLSNKIERYLKKTYISKKLNIVKNKIEYYNRIIQLEEEKQNLLTKELASILCEIDNITSNNTYNTNKQQDYNYKQINSYIITQNDIKYTKKRKKKIKKITNKY